MFIVVGLIFLVLLFLAAVSVEVSEKHLCRAAKNGNAYQTADLLRRGVSIDRKSNGWTPLGMAAVKGKATVVKMLVENGADIFQKSHGKTPLHWAAAAGKTEVVKILLDAGAAENGSVDTVGLLLDAGADINTEESRFSPIKKAGGGVLILLCFFGFAVLFRGFAVFVSGLNSSSTNPETNAAPILSPAKIETGATQAIPIDNFDNHVWKNTKAEIFTSIDADQKLLTNFLAAKEAADSKREADFQANIEADKAKAAKAKAKAAKAAKAYAQKKADEEFSAVVRDLTSSW